MREEREERDGRKEKRKTMANVDIEESAGHHLSSCIRGFHGCLWFDALDFKNALEASTSYLLNSRFQFSATEISYFL